MNDVALRETCSKTKLNFKVLLMVKKSIFISIFTCVVGIYLAGGQHFVYGSTVPIQMIKKLSWSLSETVINFDRVGNMPMIVARASYPMFLAAMEREESAVKRAIENNNQPLPSNLFATGAMNKIKKNTSREDVIGILGEPDSRIGPFANDSGIFVETFFYNGAVSIIFYNSRVAAINKN